MSTEDLSRVVAVYLTKDTCSEPCQQISSLVLPSINQPVSVLRQTILARCSSFFSERQSIVFVTPRGWEIDEALEQTVKVSSLINEESIVRLRMKYSTIRVGLVFEGQAVGFINLDSLACSLLELRIKLQDQHPHLASVLTEENALFKDNNGWPILNSQEKQLNVLNVLQSNTIYLTKSMSVTLSPNSSDHKATLRYGKSLQHEVNKSSLDQPKEPENSSQMNESIVHNPLIHQPRSPAQSRKSYQPLEIMVSYVHKESAKHAKLLSAELNRLGYSVFIDVVHIKPGDDWQDALNEAVCNCNLFIPLVTSLYGLTDWTNKEVKLADTLSKFIIPVNFLLSWPPMCLAIQFATTQYISMNMSTQMGLEVLVSKAAAEIADQYKTMQALIKEREEETKESKIEEIEDEAPSPLKKPLGPKGSLPRSLPDMIRKSIFKPRMGKSLVVISYHPAQLECVEAIRNHLESRGYDAWASMAGDDLQKREVFKKKVNTAGVVIFVISEEYATSQSCEQEVYYCEGRKRLIPVIVNSFQIPGWLSTLIGTDTFLDYRATNFEESLLEEVECATVPAKAEVRLRKLVEQKTQLHRMCTDLKKNLPNGRLVYVTGSTKISSKNTVAICQKFGELLAQQMDCFLVTGGFYGVGETVGQSFYKERQKLGGQSDSVIHIHAKKDAQDHSMQARQNPDGTFQEMSYGKTLFYSDSVRQREMLTPKVIDLCILIEGGPGAAFEAHQFSWSEHTVIPVQATGGAASGKFNVPPAIFMKPDPVQESDWSILSNVGAKHEEIAVALVNIVNSIKPPL